MVHPKNSCDELMHPALKIWNEVKSRFKINMQKDNCTTVCTKNNARQQTQQIQEIIFNHFFAVDYYQPTFYTEIFFNCSPHQWIDVIEFLLLVTRSSLEWEVRDSNLGPIKFSSKEAVLPRRNDAKMGPANSLHASGYYSEYNERFDFDLISHKYKEHFRIHTLRAFEWEQKSFFAMLLRSGTFSTCTKIRCIVFL